ncbi:hypothetical protein I552_5328 [Mycobacterium xenopi 3993]|nr:hypothetical protein I552_5328 [Mycobacterium xenopi 3993]
MPRLDYDALNATIRYLMFSVFAVRPGALGDDRERVVDETATFLKQQEERGVVVRGLYDVAGLRADADFMIWTHAERVEALQATYEDFRRTTTLGRACTPVWSSVALHRPAEFNKSHIPAFLAGEEPAPTSASIRLCGPTSGTCCRRRSAAACSPSTGWPPAATRRSARTRSRPSRWATTSGSWRSNRLNCTASST